MKKKIIPVLLTVVFAITSCIKSDHNPNSGNKGNTGATGEVDAYICGNLFLSETIWQAVFWKNNISVKLSTDSSQVFGITSQGKDVYMLGNDRSGLCYWKNGTRFEIDDKNTGYAPSAIAVQGNDVYTSGSIDFNAAYRKNGTTIMLKNPGYYGVALCITVSGNNVYACGHYFSLKTNNQIPCYWKNGICTPLIEDKINGQSGSAQSIVVNGNDVHIIINSSNEHQKNKPIDQVLYWKNGIVTPIDNAIPTRAKGLCVNGNDVYICGGETIAPYKNGYWKNGTFVSFPDIFIVNAIAVHSNDVYLTGSYRSNMLNYAAYWKNGTITKLSQNLSSLAMGVTLVPK